MGLEQGREAAPPELAARAGEVVLRASARAVDPDHRDRGEPAVDERGQAGVVVDDRRAPVLARPLLERNRLERLVRDVLRHLQVERPDGLRVVQLGERDEAHAVRYGQRLDGAGVDGRDARRADLPKAPSGRERVGGGLVERVGSGGGEPELGHMRLHGLRQLRADPATAMLGIDGEGQLAVRRVGDPPGPRDGRPADDLTGGLVGKQAQLCARRDVLEEMPHALGRDDRVGPGPLPHRRGARDVVVGSCANHGGSVVGSWAASEGPGLSARGANGTPSRTGGSRVSD